MPEFIGMLKTLKPYDKISGSSQLAKAVWALGRLGEPTSPAEIARTIRARTTLNWEGPQAAKFFRKLFINGTGAPGGPWFTRSAPPQGGNHRRPRYLYDLTDLARVYFRKKWVEGDWQPPTARNVAAVVDKMMTPTPRPFRHKDHTLGGQAKLIDAIHRQVAILTDYVKLQRDLLKRIHTCHHNHVEQVMQDIKSHLTGDLGDDS